MSDIATNLTTMANNTPSVIDAVNAAKVTASGTAVRVDDVLDAEHGLQVQLYSDSVTDFSGITVTRHGRNLFDASLVNSTAEHTSGAGITVDYEGDGVFHLYGVTSGNYSSFTPCAFWLNIPFSPTDYYTGSAYLLDGSTPVHIVPYFGVGAEKNIRINWLPIKVEPEMVAGDVSTNTRLGTQTLATARYITRFWFYIENGNASHEIDCRIKVQLELGETATEYEGYKDAQTATADANGKVKGLVSAAPTMTLLADSADVTLECAYFPESAADTYAKYQVIKQEQTALRDKLQEYLQEE